MYSMYTPISMFSQDFLFPSDISVESELEGLKSLVARKNETIAQYEEEVNRLYEIIREPKRHRFGPGKERWESDEQVCLFNEAETEAKKPENQENDSDTSIQIESFHRNREKRRLLPADPTARSGCPRFAGRGENRDRRNTSTGNRKGSL